MERNSQHGPRIDEEMEKEVHSLVTGSPVEARVEPARLQEDAGEGEPGPESVVGGLAVDTAHAPGGQLPHEEARARSELATFLRPSIFPATRAEVVQCAIEDHAPEALVELVAALPERTYANVAEVWETLGGHRESRDAATGPAAEIGRGRPAPDVPPVDPAVRAPADSPAAATAPDAPDAAEPSPRRGDPVHHRFGFRFDWRYRLAAKPLFVDEQHAFVEIDDDTLRARFGHWVVETPLTNVAGASPTGPYSLLKTIGPAHLSLADRGLTFATNRDEGVCIRFHEPVKGIDPLGVLRHPALTVTVDDVDALVASLPSAA
jgi:hypothetical protein